jgi:CRISPR/Cas system-associated exonuclease Cas4 (RecB family)
LVPAKLVAGVLSYSKQDMDDNWEWVLDRAGELQMFLDAGEPPPPFTTNAAWECKNCRYRMRCEVLKGT